MKQYILVVVSCICIHAGGQTLTAYATNNGMGTIPAFTLGKPAGLIFLTTNITPKLEFSPDFTFQLKDFKGWFLDAWLKWNQPLDKNKKWIATAGVDWSLFFRDVPLESGEGEISQSIRYPMLEGKLKYAPNAGSAFVFDYQYGWTMGKEYKDGGHYYSLQYQRDVDLKQFVLSASLNTFYLDYCYDVKGFDAFFESTIGHKKSGLFAGLHLIQPITVKQTQFDWGVQVGIKRSLHQ